MPSDAGAGCTAQSHPVDLHDPLGVEGVHRQQLIPQLGGRQVVQLIPVKGGVGQQQEVPQRLQGAQL